MHVRSLIKRLSDYPFIVSTYCTLLWRVNAYKSGTMSTICICIQFNHLSRQWLTWCFNVSLGVWATKLR